MGKRKSQSDASGIAASVALDESDVEQLIAENGLQPENTSSVIEPVYRVSGGDPQALIQHAAMLMPGDEATRRVLKERARAIAKPVNLQQHALRDQYLRFRLGAVERYGIPYPYLDELLYLGNLARVPCTPAFIAGVINYRGELLTILDLKQFFRMPSIELGDEARIIVVKQGAMRVGLLVDSVDGNEEYQEAELSPALRSEGVSNMDYVLGIHAGNVTLLNMKLFLDDPALRVSS